MRIVKSLVVGALLLALVPTVSSAQERKIHVNLGGGPTFIGGDLGDHFALGWGPAFGVTYDFTPRLAFQFEYAYRWFNIGDETLPPGATLFSANHQTHQLDFNIIGNLTSSDSPVRIYFVAGPGTYNRKVEITKYEGTGVICDPYWYVCGTYPVSSVVGSRGGWDFGFNFGGGVGFRIEENAEFFIESRFHYVAGPEFVPPAGIAVPLETSQTSNGYYYPLTFGIRF